jgi:large subunit ribosomal protein L25
MSENNQISAEIRTTFGKGAARKLRAAGKIPAVVYGHGAEPVHVAVPAHETTLIARRANALIDLSMPEQQQLVLIKDVQRDPVRQIIEHLDLVIVRKGEKVTVDIAVHVEGEPYPGLLVQLENTTVSVEAEATHIPEFVSVSVEGLEEGAKILAGQLVLPAGITLLSDPELMVIAIQAPAKAEEPSVAEEGEATESSDESAGESGDAGDSGGDSGGE